MDNSHDSRRPLRLSQTGVQRRADMLGELQGAMRQVHRRRRALRRVVAASCLLLALLAASVPFWRPGPAPHQVVLEDPAPAPPAPVVDLIIVHTDPTVLARYTPRPQSRTERLNDDALLAHLASINRPTGLIRMGGEVRLTANVVDPPREEEPPEPPSSI